MPELCPRFVFRVKAELLKESLELAAVSYGFDITRKYEGLDNRKDVVKTSDGIWQVKIGARVHVPSGSNS